jgi:hypothetical protein
MQAVNIHRNILQRFIYTNSSSSHPSLVRQICVESDRQDFTSLDFATIIILQSKVVSLASNLQPGGSGPCIYVPRDKVDQL